MLQATAAGANATSASITVSSIASGRFAPMDSSLANEAVVEVDTQSGDVLSVSGGAT